MRPLPILFAAILLAGPLQAQQRYLTQPPPQPLPRPQTTQSAKPAQPDQSTQPVKVQASKPVQTIQSSQPTPSTRLGTQAATKPELSKEQQAKQEALFKADPKLKKWAESLEARGAGINSWGNTDEAGMAAVGIKPSGQPATTGGNKTAADSAYKRKDYQAALQHYKALAADGNTEAAVMLGIMHEKGQGVDKDPAGAYAWYGRAADQGDPLAREIVRDMNDKDQMKDGELEAAGEKYEEIAKELDGPAASENAGERFRDIRQETNINAELYERPPHPGKPAEQKSP